MRRNRTHHDPPRLPFELAIERALDALYQRKDDIDRLISRLEGRHHGFRYTDKKKLEAILNPTETCDKRLLESFEFPTDSFVN